MLRRGSFWGKEYGLDISTPKNIEEFETIWHPEYVRLFESIYKKLLIPIIKIIDKKEKTNFEKTNEKNQTEKLKALDLRDHFCTILEKQTGKKINPEDIKQIPVHKNENLKVTQTDETKVFHDLDYWKQMKPSKDGFYFLQKMGGELKYRIYIFSKRKWPNKELLSSIKLEKGELNNTLKDWGSYRYQRQNTILKVTKDWLKAYEVPFIN